MAQYATGLKHDGLDVLTPRTPFSRAGRAENAMMERAKLNLDDDDFDEAADFSQHQRAPLLTSSADDSFPHRRTGTKSKGGASKTSINWTAVLKHGPLVAGIATAIILLFMVLMSVDTPEQLHTYLHGSPTPFKNITHEIISHDDYTYFPLSPTEYRDECANYQAKMTKLRPYWWTPEEGSPDVLHDESEGMKNVCKSSITYQLDGEVGLAADLALIAQAAGLAREQNRTFFIDDQYWNRGRWSDYFEDVRALQPGPEPGCLPPPPKELVACPRTSRHWVLNSRTAIFHFGGRFQDAFENPKARMLRRQKPIFERAEYSLKHTIRPTASSAADIRAIRRELASLASSSQPDSASYAAVHIRHGDRKAESWRYHGGFVPYTDYAAALLSARIRLSPFNNQEVMTIYVASDDPQAREELAKLVPDVEGNRVRLFSLAQSADPELRRLASWTSYNQQDFKGLDDDERMQLTRGAIIDFALTTGLWEWTSTSSPSSSGDLPLEGHLEATVCTISSNICKLAAVGLGWDRAFGFETGDPDKNLHEMVDERKRWLEIDNRGDIEPTWRALEMFNP